MTGVIVSLRPLDTGLLKVDGSYVHRIVYAGTSGRWSWERANIR